MVALCVATVGLSCCQDIRILIGGCSQSKIFRRGFSVVSVRDLLWDENGVLQLPGLQQLLQLCAKEKLHSAGKSCHALALHAGLGADTVTCNILMNFYTKLGCNAYAFRIFDAMPARSTVSWNTMISGFTRHGDGMEALKLFIRMRREVLGMSEFTLSSTICACSSKCAVAECQQLHSLALKTALSRNVHIGTAIVDVYGKCSMIGDAISFFNSMQEKSLVTWSSMVAGYVRNNLCEEAFTFLRSAVRTGVEFSEFTLSSIVSACASLPLTVEGRQLHAVLIRVGFFSSVFVATSLVDFYSRCGLINDACILFRDAKEKNVALCNAMMSGFSRHAQSQDAIALFEEMLCTDMKPNEVTYISILSACAHSGLVEDGRRYFRMLMDDRNVQADALHYSCMVDVLGRAGLTNEAYELILQMPFKPTAGMWGSLLGSCKRFKNTQLAEIAARQLFKIEPCNGANHVMLSDIYAAGKKWVDVEMARKRLKESGAKKVPGKSWIEVKGRVHVFVVRERNHPSIQEIYSKIDDLYSMVKKLSYKTNTEWDLHPLDEHQKEELLKHHSEKLALAFGLISLPSAVPIRIFKNLRICADCHSFIKLVSDITKREVIVRDLHRFHHFNDGACSCRDFW